MLAAINPDQIIHFSHKLYKRTAWQEDKRTGEIPNIAYTIVLDELWYFTCPSCPQGREIASYHLKSSEKKGTWEIEGF